MGRYVPPDVEGTISGNALNKKHALGNRASKLKTEGILTVRFEMPFGVWCDTCEQTKSKPTIIGQGVRFNAEKKKVGNYHSTPIWSFRMRHTDCGGLLEIRTDPANAEYVVHEGGRRRDTGESRDLEDSLVASSAGGLVGVGSGGEILTEKEREDRRRDAFARLEKTIEDRQVLVERSHRIAELEDVSARAWEDPYALNRKLRDAFRVGRRKRDEEAGSARDLQERLGLGMEVLPGTEDDARRAGLVDFGVGSLDDDDDDDGETRKDKALIKPLFGTSATTTTDHADSLSRSKAKEKRRDKDKVSKKRLKSELKASKTRASLASEVAVNARASLDPFLVSAKDRSCWTPRIQGIKRKRTTPIHTPESSDVREDGERTGDGDDMGPGTTTCGEKMVLVEYDSD